MLVGLNQGGVCGRGEKSSLISKQILQIERKSFANRFAMVWERKRKDEDDSKVFSQGTGKITFPWIDMENTRGVGQNKNKKFDFGKQVIRVLCCPLLTICGIQVFILIDESYIKVKNSVPQLQSQYFKCSIPTCVWLLPPDWTVRCHRAFQSLRKAHWVHWALYHVLPVNIPPSLQPAPQVRQCHIFTKDVTEVQKS